MMARTLQIACVPHPIRKSLVHRLPLKGMNVRCVNSLLYLRGTCNLDFNGVNLVHRAFCLSHLDGDERTTADEKRKKPNADASF